MTECTLLIDEDEDNIIPVCIKRQTWKQYPTDLYQREFILVVNWKSGILHQFMQDGLREMFYTW